jgi:holin-like protein
MAYIKQFGIILGVTFAAEIVRYFVPLPVPASIYSLILMLLLLITKVIKPEQVRDAALFLVGILQLIFISAAVGLIESYSEFSGVLLQSVIIIIVSSVIVTVATGLTAQGIQNAAARKAKKN